MDNFFNKYAYGRFSGVLEEGINELDNEATTKAKFFYQSCMDLRKYSGSLAAFFTHLSMY